MLNLIYHTKKKALSIPEEPVELSGKQFCAIAALIHSNTNKLRASIKALQILSGLPWLRFAFISAETKLNALPYVQWIFEKLNITDQLLPNYKNYYGPSSCLNNLTLAEFHFAETHYAELYPEAENNVDDIDTNKSHVDFSVLNRLVAVLYRQVKKNYNHKLNKDGDPRRHFNSNTVDYYANKISKWPKGVRLAILMFYDGCRNKIADDNQEIFSGGSDSSDSTGMYGVMRGLAGPKFGKLEEVEGMLLHNALLELNLIRIEQQELEAKYKTA